MDHSRAQPQASEAEFDAIQAALLETARGRWFLDELARRTRSADTEALLDAMRRLEHAVVGRPALPPSGGADAPPAPAHRADAIPVPFDAPEAEAVIGAVREAATGVLTAAAELADLAVALRTAEGESWLTDEIARAATAIRTAGQQQQACAADIARLVRRPGEDAAAPPRPAIPAPAFAAEDDDLFGDEPAAPAPPSLELLELREQLRRFP